MLSVAALVNFGASLNAETNVHIANVALSLLPDTTNFISLPTLPYLLIIISQTTATGSYSNQL